MYIQEKTVFNPSVSISTIAASYLPTTFWNEFHFYIGQLKILEYIASAFPKRINQSTDSKGVVR